MAKFGGNRWKLTMLKCVTIFGILYAAEYQSGSIRPSCKELPSQSATVVFERSPHAEVTEPLNYRSVWPEVWSESSQTLRELEYRAKFSLQLGVLDYAEAKAAPVQVSTRTRESAPTPVPAGEAQPSDTHRSDGYLERARDLVDRLDYWEALPYLEKMQLNELPPSLRAKALLLMARALVAIHRVASAREKLDQAIALDPSKSEGFIGLSWAEFLLGDRSAAAQVVEIGRRKWPEDHSLRVIASLIARESLPVRDRVPFGQEWHLTGEGVVCCPCDVPCPCRSNAPPTDGHCESASAAHIRRGHYGKVALDGLTFSFIYNCMQPGDSTPVLFVDQAAKDEQLIALERIFQSFDTLQPSVFLRVNRGPITFVNSRQDHTYNIEIPGRLQLKVRRLLDGSGNPVLPTAALDRYSNTIEYATNLAYRLWDEQGQIRLDYSGRQANFRIIDLDSKSYQNGMMLIQFSDGSGFFNEKQLKIIQSLKLPMLSSYPRPTKSKPSGK